MPSSTKILPHYTYEDYCQWEGRWELIEGIPFAMSPTHVPRHQWISSNIKYELKDGIKKSGCKKCRVYDFIDVKLSEDTILQPDAVVVCNEITKPFLDFPAALVVEVLSTATAMKDRNNKFYLYQSQKIAYYVVIDPDKNEVEIYHLKENGKYALEKVASNNTYQFILEQDCLANVVLDNIWD